jgi:hypothetical protein
MALPSLITNSSDLQISCKETSAVAELACSGGFSFMRASTCKKRVRELIFDFQVQKKDNQLGLGSCALLKHSIDGSK